MSSLSMSVCPSVRPSWRKLLSTVLNINLSSRLISNSARILDRVTACFLFSAYILLCEHRTLKTCKHNETLKCATVYSQSVKWGIIL